MTIDSKTLDELDALHAAATPGPWTVEVEEYGNSGSVVIPEIERNLHDTEWADPEDFQRDQDNAEYIAAACNALPHLTARVREIEAQFAAAREDSARLDAMSGFGWSVRFFEGRNGNRYEVYTTHGLFVSSGKTPREAIDSARRLSGGSR